MKKSAFNYKIILVTLLIGAFLSPGIICSKASSLSYQQDIGVSFTFNPTISLSLSSANISIDNLAPGTASDSNVITINVLTNTSNGYILNASVGNDSSFATAGRDLIHNSNTVTDKIASVDFGSSIATNTDLANNTWAYSYLDESLNNGTNTTWANYSGLPLYSDTTNIATIKTSTTPVQDVTGDKVKFKIAAKASSALASGEYNNVINFTLVATPIPTTLEMAFANAGKAKVYGFYKKEDLTDEICNTVEVVGQEGSLVLIDTSDNSFYTAVKLANGECQATKNQ